MFEMNVTKFAKQVSFVQKVKITDDTKPISGYLEFMTCDDTRCLPPAEVDFSFTLKKKAKTAQTADAGTAKTANKAAQSSTDAGSKQTQIEAAPQEKKPATEATTVDNTATNTTEDKPKKEGILDPVKWNLAVEKQAIIHLIYCLLQPFKINGMCILNF